MPKDASIKRVLVVGSGPIVIGQAAEFDYSGTQAIKALKAEGVFVILLNSNPATIMTEPDLADRTYIEPITPEVATTIIEREKPDALLPTMGGQTALNLAKALAESGVLKKHGVRLIGASLEAINKAEDRQLFKAAMERIGLELPKSVSVGSWAEAKVAIESIGYPAIVRPSFTLGGTGGGIARNPTDFERICHEGLRASPISTLLIEESVLGWKEFELEVIRDKADNGIIVCSIENLDPMGVHTGDSITVAPAQTLTDREFQRMRGAALAIMREIGVETGGSNVQFAVNPVDGRMLIVEMNPRVSRSSALASKATGYPIAKIAAKLALGFTLDELKNDITRHTPASFEPALDYVVVKIPRFDFEKFRGADDTLGTSMKAVGEAMAIGRTFTEAFFKALRSGASTDALAGKPNASNAEVEAGLLRASPQRVAFLLEALRRGVDVARISKLSGIDPWFLRPIADVLRNEKQWAEPARLLEAKSLGLSNAHIASLRGVPEAAIRAELAAAGRHATFKRVDTCAAEFESFTPYMYSTWEDEDETPPPSGKTKVVILGSGPIRIGQGIEFDTCCVEAVTALRQAGFETVMINCNPETVSTDYDTADRLYFEPLTVEDVLAILRREQALGVIVQLGGQTPLKLALELQREGVKILGTSPDAIDRAEDRERFQELISELGLKQADGGMARSLADARRVAERVGYPVMVRPSYVLGGRAMQVVRNAEELERYMQEAVSVSNERPVLIDRFLTNALEIDLDLVCDEAGDVLIGGLLEHVEEAGIHSGDAASTLPPHSLSPFLVQELGAQATLMAQKLGVVGLMNVQFAVQGTDVYVLEVNPRASRTVPFIAKATGVPLARLAALCMVGKRLADLPRGPASPSSNVAVKESVFPFARFAGVDTLLGPEMKSTGEVMGLGPDFETAFAKAQIASGVRLPTKGRVFISVRDEDKQTMVGLARRLEALGYTILAPDGTAKYLATSGDTSTRVNKVLQGSPHVVEILHEGKIDLLFNTTSASPHTISDSFSMRREALMLNVPYYTTLEAARMAVGAIEVMARGTLGVCCLQDHLEGRA